MRLADVCGLLQARMLTDDADGELVVSRACGSDLLSDVLAFTRSGALLLTGLSHPQVIRTAEFAAIPAIIFVRGKAPSAETLALARERGIALLQTDCSLFEACGRLWAAGLKGCDAPRPASTPGERGGVAVASAHELRESEATGAEHGR